MKCVLCKERPGKRQCPGAGGYICTLCCGQEREVSIECPFECPFLVQGHRNEMERATPPLEISHPQHEVSRGFVEENERFVGALALRLLEAVATVPGMVDADLRAVLDSLIRTWETLSTGLVYESLPEGPSRAHVFREVKNFIEGWQRAETERSGLSARRDGDVLRSLVFLRRLAQTHESPRPRAKLFYGYLRSMFPAVAVRQQQSLIVP